MIGLPNLSKYLIFLLLLSSWGCGSVRLLNRKEVRTLASMLEASPVLRKSFTGFALFDPASGEMLYQQDADKYFTPASNTKIFTFYTAWQVLGERMPLLHYGLQGDTLIFWGAGNPTLLHPDFPQPWYVLEILRRFQGAVFYSDHNFRDERFGPGWAWDDYPYYYQTEKAALPLYGNMVRVSPGFGDSLRVQPDVFAHYFTISDSGQTAVLRRAEFDNQFEVQPSRLNRAREVPYFRSPEWVTRLLADTLHREVGYWSGPLPAGIDSVTLYVPAADTLYRRLMQDSDNFVAEQLLLMVSDQVLGYQHTADAIAYARDSLLSDLPDPPQWWDGSGLSRYNLFTPRSLVAVLHKLYGAVPTDRLPAILPAGGKSGTIRNWYGAPDGPYVFAKTGTLRNKHCLSGYLHTRSGRILIFSFMHNNFITGSDPLKREMAQVLEFLREAY